MPWTRRRSSGSLASRQRILTRVTGRQPSVLCYPTGRYSDLTLEVAERYYNFGLKMVGGQYNTADDPFLVSRYYVSRYTGLDSFAAMVAPAAHKQAGKHAKTGPLRGTSNTDS